YANYLVWFEVGRTEWLRSRGYAYRSLEGEGVFLPVTEASCRYLAPSRYDDLVWIVTRVGRLGRTIVRFDYRILKEDGTLAAEGHTEHCFLSREGRRCAPRIRSPACSREARAEAFRSLLHDSELHPARWAPADPPKFLFPVDLRTVTG